MFMFLVWLYTLVTVVIFHVTKGESQAKLKERQRRKLLERDGWVRLSPKRLLFMSRRKRKVSEKLSKFTNAEFTT